MKKIDRKGYDLYLTMNPLIRDILDKMDELEDENDDLRKAYHSEMSTLGGEVGELRKEIKRLRGMVDYQPKRSKKQRRG